MAFKLQQSYNATVNLRSLAWDLGAAPEAITDFHPQKILFAAGRGPKVLGAVRGKFRGPVIIDFGHEGAPCYAVCAGQKVIAAHHFRDGVLGVTDGFGLFTQTVGQDPKHWNLIGTDGLSPILGAQIAVEGDTMLVPCLARGDAIIARVALNPAINSAQIDLTVRLNPADFPSGGDTPPFVGHALLSDGQCYIQTGGRQVRPRGGYPYGIIAEIDLSGHMSQRLLWQEYKSLGDAKKRGFTGRFTSSGRYFLHDGLFKSTDPWQGQRVVFDLKTQEFHSLSKPEGQENVAIFDHLDGIWWGARVMAPHSLEIAAYSVA